MKKGLVMEGGALKGMFTMGILDVFLEEGITFDGAVGVSAGAAFGCNYKSHQKGRAIRYNRKLCGDRRYASFWNLLTTGNFYNVDFCYRVIPYEFDLWDGETFAKDPMDFWTVATDLETGKADYHLCTDGGELDLAYIRSSASVPIVSRIVDVEGKKLLDGGIGDPIPLRFFEEKGYEKIVVIPTKPRDYVRKASNGVYKAEMLLYRHYPKFVEAATNLHVSYNECFDYVKSEEEKGHILVLWPKAPLVIGGKAKSVEELDTIYQMGRTVALERLEEIKAFLA